MDTPATPREQLEDLITILANAWLQKMPRTSNTYDAEINTLLNLSLHTAHELLAKNILKEVPAGVPLHVTKERLQSILTPPVIVAPPVPPPRVIYNPPLTDETNGKTFTEGWLYKLRGSTNNDDKLHEVLRWMRPQHPYLEDINEEVWAKFSRSRLLWEFFVKKRGY